MRGPNCVRDSRDLRAALAIPVYDENANANAGRALAALQAHELFLSTRNAPAGGEQQRR